MTASERGDVEPPPQPARPSTLQPPPGERTAPLRLPAHRASVHRLGEFVRERMARVVAAAAGLGLLLVVGAAAIAVVALSAPPVPAEPVRDRVIGPALDVAPPGTSAAAWPPSQGTAGGSPGLGGAPAAAVQVTAETDRGGPVVRPPAREDRRGNREDQAPSRLGDVVESAPAPPLPPLAEPPLPRFDLPAPTDPPEPTGDVGWVTDPGIPTEEGVTDPEVGDTTEPLQ